MQISDSIQFLLSHKEKVIETFYHRFLDRNPAARVFFDGVNVSHQATMLTMALLTVECHFSNAYPATAHYLRVLGNRHNDWGIPRDMYPAFRDCLLETLGEFHGKLWDAELSGAWRAALDQSIAVMLEGYEHEYIY